MVEFYSVYVERIIGCLSVVWESGENGFCYLFSGMDIWGQKERGFVGFLGEIWGGGYRLCLWRSFFKRGCDFDFDFVVFRDECGVCGVEIEFW